MAINIYSGAKKKRNEQQTAKQITAFPVTAAYVASKQSGSAAQSANKTATQTTGGQSGANILRPTPLNIAADAVRERYNAQRSITTPSAASSIVSTAQTNPIRPTPLNIALESAADANKNLTYLEARKRSLESDLAGWLVDEEDRKAWTEELASIEQQIAESKAARQRLGMNEEAPTFWQRLGNVGKAAAAGTGADYASMAGTWREAGMNTSGDIVNTALENYRKEQAREQSIIDAYEAGTGEYTEADYEEALRQKEYLQFYIDAYAKASGVEEQAPELFRQTANDLAEVSAQETEKAKEGLGTVGQLLADAGVAGVQMITDTATSGGASAMPSMMARVFGGKAREGQEKGYSVQKQVATGAAAATISFLTEMLGANPLMGEKGGIIDDVISRYLAPNSPAVAKLMDIPANALGEGLEEVAENILTELSDYLIAGDSVEISAAELGREGLIGALLGGAGQIAGTAVNTAARAMSNNATGQIGKTETENAAPVMVDESDQSVYNIINNHDSQGGSTGATGAGRSVEENRGGVSGLHSGGNADYSGQRRSGKIPVDSGFVLSEQAVSTIYSRGVDVAETKNVSANGAAFSIALDEARLADAKNGWAVTPKTEHEIVESGVQVFMDSNGAVGFGIAPDGDIEAVFANKSKGAPRRATDSIIPEAIANGGTKLDCYGPELVKIYARHGFVPVARVAFNPEYANTGWDISKGTPDIYFMMATDTDPDSVVRNYGSHHIPTKAELDSLPIMDYDSAYAYRDELLRLGTQPGQSVNRFPSPITDAIEAAETAEVPIDQAGIYGRSVGAAVPLKGKLVESRTNLLEDLNLSEQARQQIYENTLPHERVSESLAGERAAANYEVRDSDGRLLNLNDIVWELKEKAEKFSQVGPEEVKAAERALVNLQHEAQQTGNWTKFRRFNSEVVQTLKTTSGQTLQAWAEFSRTPAHMVAEAMDIMDAAVEAADDVEAAAQRDETATKIAEDAEAIQQAVDSENAASLRELIRQISTERGYAPSKGVSDALEKIQSMETLQEMATMASYGRALDMLPESFAKKLGTWQTTAHLLNPKTLLRNYIANTVFAPVDTVAHDVGLFTDFVLALIQSGEGKGSVKQNRTVGFENPFTKRDAEYVAAARARNALDIREDKGGKYFAGGRVFDRNGNGFNRAMNRAEGALGWGLNVTDAMQKAKSKAQSEQALKGLVESGGKVTRDVANRITEQEMLYRSFQRSTGIGDALQGIKDVLNIAGFGAETKRLKGQYSVREFGLGDLTTKYTTVPGALIHTAADYTPLAAFNVARDIAAMVKFNRAEGDAKTETMRGQYQGMTNAEAAAMAQYNAAVGMGRLLTGSGIMMIGAMAVRAGLVGFRPYDRDEREEYAARSALGESGLQLNINAAARWFAGQGGEWKDGDLLMDLGQFQPIDTLIKIAAVIEDEDDEKWSRAIDAVVEGLASSIEELNMMQTARTVINDFRYRSDDETAWETAKQIGLDILSGAATGFIPGPVRNLATALDRYKRDTSADTAAQELVNKMIAAIPGLRNTLPAKLDYTGQPLENENALLRTLNAQVLPMTVNTYKEDEVLDYLDSLPDGSSLYPDVYAPSSFSNNGVDYTLNTEQQREYLTTYRQTYYSLAQEFSGNSFTTAMSEELQRETLKDLNAFAAQEAKRQAVEAAGGEYKRTSYNYLYDDNGELMFEDPGSVIALRNAYNNMVDSDYQDSADFEKMYGWFQNQGDGAGWMSNTLHGEQLKIAEAIGGLEKMAVCIRAGMTPQEYGEAKAYHDELNRDENLSPSARATDFAYWLSKQGFSSRELAAAKSTLTFSFGGVVSAEKYEELTESGISASDSNKVFDAVDALEVEDGYSTVRDVQRYEAIAGLNGMSEEDKLTAIGVYAGTNSSTYAYYKAAYDCGVELSEYVSVLRDIESYQKDRNKSTSSVSQGELYLALYYADITEQQRQYIYYVYATQKGWKNTSYNGAASAGTEVYREVLAARTQ